MCARSASRFSIRSRERETRVPPGVGLAGKRPASLVEFLAAGLWTFYDGMPVRLSWLSWGLGQCAAEERVQVGSRRREGLRRHRRERIRIPVGRCEWLSRIAARFGHRVHGVRCSRCRQGERRSEAALLVLAHHSRRAELLRKGSLGAELEHGECRSCGSSVAPVLPLAETRLIRSLHSGTRRLKPRLTHSVTERESNRVRHQRSYIANEQWPPQP